MLIPDKKNIVILTVEDSAVIRMTIRSFLEDLGYSVLEAANGREGIEIFKDQRPDLLLVDLRMPEVDGLEVLANVREISPDTPMIVVSGAGKIREAIDALRNGAWDYILKPIEDMGVLQHAVERALERMRLIHENLNYQKHLEDEVARQTEELREKEARLTLALEATDSFVWSMNIHSNELSIDQSFYKYFGYQSNDLKTFDDFIAISDPAQIDNIKKQFTEHINGRKPNYDVEYRIKAKDGSWYWINTRARLIAGIKDVKPEILIGTSVDITRRKLAEEQIKSSLREKEILLREIHHRVNNNMQIVSSLLNLQSQYIQNDDDRKIFHENQNRIQSMALVHEKLYEAQDLAQIDFSDYISQIFVDLQQVHFPDSKLIKLNLDIAEMYLGIVTAVPVALIVHELISNALKYAFPKGRAGSVDIIFKRSGASKYILEICDDGIGLPENIDLHEAQSLGMTLVNALIVQLDATIDISRDSGTKYIITFPVKDESG